MKDRHITTYIRKSEVRKLLFPLLLLITALIILIHQPLFDYFTIAPVSADEPLKDAVNDQFRYVRIHARDLYYTGDDYYVDGQLTGHYYYQLSESYLRIYILTPQAGRPAEKYLAARQVTGQLVKMGPASAALFDDLAEQLDWTGEGLYSICDPYLVNEVIYFPIAERILFGLILIALVIGTAGLLYTLFLLAFPKLSPGYRRLRRYGDADRIVQDAEREIRDNTILEARKLTLTPKYLIEFDSDRTAVIPLESVLWVFHLRDMKYSLRERRERMLYSLRITTITGDVFTLKDYRKNELDKIMEVLTERYPNFFYDYSEEHERMVDYILEENRKELRARKDRLY